MSFLTKELHMMGTTITLQIDHLRAEELLQEASLMLKDFERRFNANSNDSDLMRINHSAGHNLVTVDQDLFELIRIGKEYSIASHLNLNIAIGPLVKLWHIGFADANKPSDSSIQAALKLIQAQDIILDEEHNTVFLKHEGMEIDLGGIAKGYFADLIKSFLVKENVKHGLINLGGNVLTIGQSLTHEHGYWRIGIQKLNRNRGDILGFVEVIDQSVVTSGIYERNLVVNGRLYHHVLDSNTGYPIHSTIGSITIIADDSLTCELWTTILFHLEPQEAIQTVNNLSGIEAIIIDIKETVYLSEGIKNRFTLI